MSGTVPSNVGEITHGVIYGIAPNTLAAKQIFDAAWSRSWGNWFNTWGLPKMAYNYDSGSYYQNFAYQIIAGNANQIGCAYRNLTDSNQYATVCHIYPKGLAANVAVYLTGPTCSACPATAPCNTAKGLCLLQASG